MILADTVAKTASIFFNQAATGSRLSFYCGWVADIVCRYRNIALIDFMIESPFTTKDENFLDQIHYRVPVAQEIAHLMAVGAFSQTDEPQFYRYCSNLTINVN